VFDSSEGVRQSSGIEQTAIHCFQVVRSVDMVIVVSPFQLTTFTEDHHLFQLSFKMNKSRSRLGEKQAATR
jgi:hypothetical protein